MESIQISQLLAATGGSVAEPGIADRALDRVCPDSRRIRQGDLFWAIKGDRHDGHDYVEEACRNGAVACVVERRVGASSSIRSIHVEHTLRALADFARWYRQQREALIIGVTGSVGKTTTREMIYAALGAEHAGIRSQHNFNNEIGLPLSLLELGVMHDFAVLEMGARQVGDIRFLCDIARPEVGVITAIGPAHLESFGGLEKILEGKGELFDSLPSSGFAVLPGDDPLTASLAKRAACPVILVGQSSENSMRASRVETTPDQLNFQVDGYRYEVPVTGRHALPAAMCAVAIGREIGMRPEAIAHGLKNFIPEPGRCHVKRIGAWTVIDDTYNSNPASMRAACEMLRDWPGANRRLLITGDMLELGEQAAEFHRELGDRIARTGIDCLLAFGPHAEQVAEGAWNAGLDTHKIADCTEIGALLAVLDCWLADDDVILIKGSRGMRMERVVEWLENRSAEELRNQSARSIKRACA